MLTELDRQQGDEQHRGHRDREQQGHPAPGTGGIGTILFTFVGAAAIGYGIYRKRTAKTVA